MTCIVGIERDGKVYLGGDLLGSNRCNKFSVTHAKVFKTNGVVFGYTDSFRFGQILEHFVRDFTVPDDPNKIYKWLVTELVPEIKQTLEEHGYTDEDGVTCLIGIKDQLWKLQSGFSVLRSVDTVQSVGSGYEYALGAIMSDLKNYPERDAEDMVKKAIEVSSHFCPSVGSESVVITT